MNNNVKIYDLKSEKKSEKNQKKNQKKFMLLSSIDINYIILDKS